MTASERVYLDHNATAPLRPEARAAMLAALDAPSNPSSVHREGRRAREVVEQARTDVARLAGAKAENVVFVSGATEAAAHALAPDWRVDGGWRPVSALLIGATEHPCVQSGGRVGEARKTILPVDGDGRIDLAALADRLAAHDRAPGLALVALQLANNETGAIQPVAEAAAIARRHGALLVCDAVQAAGREMLDIGAFGADALFFSSHKIGGPAGAGALIFADAGRRPRPLITGGGQEQGARAGTESVAAIAGFGAAARAAAANVEGEANRLRVLRDFGEAALLRIAPRLTIFARRAPRLANTICFAAPDVRAETLLMALDLAGFAVSSGSACSSGKVGRSHVLAAMGVSPHLADGAVRVSLGWSSTRDDMIRFAAAFENAMATLDSARSRHAA